MLQIFLKEGILKKLSRKVMQPRMFFLVQYKLSLPLFIASTVLHNIIMIILVVLSHSHLVQNVFCADLNAIKCKSKKKCSSFVSRAVCSHRFNTPALAAAKILKKFSIRDSYCVQIKTQRWWSYKSIMEADETTRYLGIILLWAAL